MADTQWPRYQVFVQTTPDALYQDVGSVHAPDAEIALLNGRDVFARRPECVSMWVVPAEAIYAYPTQEASSERGDEAAGESQQPEIEVYYVCCKHRPASPMTVVGKVEALSPPQAMQRAIAAFSASNPSPVWWVFPLRRVTSSNPDEAASFYAPARDKTFRLSTDFHTLSAMRTIQASNTRGDE